MKIYWVIIKLGFGVVWLIMILFDVVLLDKLVLFIVRSFKKYVWLSSKGIFEIKMFDIEIDILVKFLMLLFFGLVFNFYVIDLSLFWLFFVVYEVFIELLFGLYVNFKLFILGGELLMIILFV